MAQGKPQLKFERNPCNNFRDNPMPQMDDGRTDGQQSHTVSSADRSKAELKILCVQNLLGLA